MAYEIIERVGISLKNYDDAVSNIITTVHQEQPISWFEVVEQRGRVTPEGQIEYQATVKIGRKRE